MLINGYKQIHSLEFTDCLFGHYGRKEFQWMLEFIKQNKEKVTHFLVYLLDRFGVMRLSKELHEIYSVTIIAVRQPIDTSNSGGVFHQNMQFLFSEYEN